MVNTSFLLYHLLGVFFWFRKEDREVWVIEGANVNSPGFIVMNIPQDQTRLISLPSKTNLFDPTVNAVRIERIC